MRWRTSRLVLVQLVVLLFSTGALVPDTSAGGGLKSEAAETQAQQVLKTTGVKGGVISHVGCGDGALTTALRADDRYLVHGLDTDRKAIRRVREDLQSRGLYGPVSVAAFDGRHLPYRDNLVTLLVASQDYDVAREEMLRVLAPGGQVCIRDGDGWQTVAKPRHEAIDEWTHFLHGADNNAVARDTQVAPPRHLQWKAGPMWCRSHDGVASSIAALVSANGRTFCLLDEGMIGQPKLPQRWTLVARDAFNGVPLWKRPMRCRSPWCLVAKGDRVWTTLKRRGPVCVLDAATGDTIATWEETAGTDHIAWAGDRVVVHVRAGKSKRRSKAGAGEGILALNPDDGSVRWRAKAKGFAGGALAVGAGRVCYHDGKAVVGLDLRTGEELWRVPAKAGRRGTLMIYQGVVLASGRSLRAIAADTGKLLWKKRGGGRDLFGASGLLWPGVRTRGVGSKFHWRPRVTEATGYDPRTGEAKRRITVDRLTSPGHHYRCYRPKATERYLLMHKRGVEFVDLRGDNHMRHNWLRAPCRHGFVPCNGLLYMPPHQCFCYPGAKLNGFLALAGGPDEERGAGEGEPRPRLERGPAYGELTEARGPSGDSSADWPMYRHDPRRSGCTSSTAPAEPSTAWSRELGDTISPPVVAGGRLYVADIDAHAVRCLDASDGSPLWSYTAGARVDSPPTVYRGLVLFGCTEGHVYCLRASDGELVWRFRAAPRERLIGAFGQLESAWPAHGSVLVQDGLAYATAGRSSYLDGGIYVYAIEPATGKVVHRTRLWSGRPDVTREPGRPYDMEGTRSDILVSDGEDIYMFHTRLNPDLTRQSTPRITKLGDREVGQHLMCNDGFLDKTWFDRSYWFYGRRWPGFYFAYAAPKSGQILVFDEQTTYGVHVFRHRRGHSPMFKPADQGYELFADANACRPVLRPTEVGREKGTSYARSLLPRWSQFIPVRVVAMVLAGERLYIAGPPDVVPKDDPMAAFEGRKGAAMWVVDASTGETLAEQQLDHVPTFDGLIAANGRLFLVTADGRVLCLSGKPS